MVWEGGKNTHSEGGLKIAVEGCKTLTPLPLKSVSWTCNPPKSDNISHDPPRFVEENIDPPKSHTGLPLQILAWGGTGPMGGNSA